MTEQPAPELRALVTAYSALMDAAVRLHPLVTAAVTAASTPGGEQPPDEPNYNWPEGERSVRGLCWTIAGCLENDADAIRQLADDLNRLRRRLDESAT